MNRTIIAVMAVSTLGLWSCEKTVRHDDGLLAPLGKTWTEVNQDEFKGLRTLTHGWTEVKSGDHAGAYFFHQARNVEELDGAGLRVLLKQSQSWPPKRTWQIGPDAMVSYTANQTPKGGVNWVAESGSVELVPHDGEASESTDAHSAGFKLRVHVTLVSSQNAATKKEFSGVVDEVASIACHQNQQPPVAEMQALWPPRSADLTAVQPLRPDSNPAQDESPALCEASTLSANFKACMGYFNHAAEVSRSYDNQESLHTPLEKGDCRW